MRVTSTRTVHVELTDDEVTKVVNALTTVFNVLRTHDRLEADQHGLLLKLKTELTGAPR